MTRLQMLIEWRDELLGQVTVLENAISAFKGDGDQPEAEDKSEPASMAAPASEPALAPGPQPAGKPSPRLAPPPHPKFGTHWKVPDRI